jgi:type VI protein secretion system component Hcp
MLMMFVISGSTCVAGESETAINTSHDPLLTGPGGTFKAGFFFEVQDFDFGLGLQDEDSAADPANAVAAMLQAHGAAANAKGQAAAPKLAKPRFGKWVNGDNSITYPATLDAISFGKQLDVTSPVLFEMCGQSKSFASAVLVRRRVGGGSGTVPHLMSFLRIDFTKVLVTDVDWDSGDDSVKEKVKFICRSVKVQYAPQTNIGTHKPAVTGDWPKT